MTQRRLLIALILVLLLVIAVPGWGYWQLKRSLPPLSGSAGVPGLESQVAVNFDEHAVPYIEARSDSDLYMAQGYVTARDRMFQMDMYRRCALGQMSEVFGSSWLPTDRLMRTLGIKGLAYGEFDKLTAPSRAALEAYADGVNDYIKEYAGRLPLEFGMLGYIPRSWRAEDTLAILKYQAYQIDESWRLDDFRQRVANRVGEDTWVEYFRDDLLDPKAPERAPPAKAQVPPAMHTKLLSDLSKQGDIAHSRLAVGPSIGSTTWAVPADATEGKSPLLVCNKDGVITSPSEWYLCSLNSPAMHVAGASIPGIPGIVVGRNESLSWGSSALKADVQDVYIEQFKSQFDSSYRTADGYQDAEVRTEVIPVRFGKDVEHKVALVGERPVLLRDNKAAVSLAWTGLETKEPTFNALFEINHANSVESFKKALSKYCDPPMMFICATQDGTIISQAAGLIPVRAQGGTGEKLNTGWKKKGIWESFVPFEDLPHSQVESDAKSPAAQPLIAAGQKIDTGKKLDLGHQWSTPYRALRLQALLSKPKSKISLVDMLALETDRYSAVGPVVADTLQKAAIATQLVDRTGLYSVKVLDRWDAQLTAEGTEGSIYEAFLQVFARRLTEPTLGRELATEYLQRWPLWLTLAQSVMQNKPERWLAPEERSYDTFFMTTLVQALKSLHITFDSDNPSSWAWGNIHRAIFNQMGGISTNWFSRWYRVGPVPVGGAPECINSCDVMFDPAALRYAARIGPTERMIVDMSDRDKFYQVINTGQSGHLMSDHRTDQLKAWTSVDFLPIAFSPTQIQRQSKHRLTLESY